MSDSAFPQPFLTDGEGRLKGPGLSARAYLAAHADITWDSVLATLHHRNTPKPSVQQVIELRAELAVRYADAVLSELAKTP